MKITEAHIQHIIAINPQAIGNNTTFLTTFYEATCDSRNIPATWENIKVIMKEYKPEALTRKRRQFVESTKEQRQEEENYIQEYSSIPNC